MTYAFAPFGGGSRVVSLWDMLRFHADKFVEVFNVLNGPDFIIGLEKAKGTVEFPDPLWDRLLRYASRHVENLREQLQELGLPVSAKRAGELYLNLTTSVPGVSPETRRRLIKQDIEELRRRVADELEGRAFFYIPDHVGLLSDPAPFGERVDEAYPSARHDISEAGCCLALKRSTACVLHLMRVLEPGLVSLAAALGVSMPRKSWEMIINKLEKEIVDRSSNPPDEKWKEEDEPFFSGAASHFRIIKNAWRNHAMHGRDKYTEQEAEDIYRSVRAFMQHLSERLSEEGLSS